MHSTSVILDSQISASTWYHSLYYSRISGSYGWRPYCQDIYHWLQVDLLSPHLLTGLVTQGNDHYNYYVSSFSLKYSLTGSMFTMYKDEKGDVKVRLAEIVLVILIFIGQSKF